MSDVKMSLMGIKRAHWGLVYKKNRSPSSVRCQVNEKSNENNNKVGILKHLFTDYVQIVFPNTGLTMYPLFRPRTRENIANPS